MAVRPDQRGDQKVSVTGTYELLNVFGRPTGSRLRLTKGEVFPSAPIGQSWALVNREEDVDEATKSSNSGQ